MTKTLIRLLFTLETVKYEKWLINNSHKENKQFLLFDDNDGIKMMLIKS